MVHHKDTHMLEKKRGGKGKKPTVKRHEFLRTSQQILGVGGCEGFRGG